MTADVVLSQETLLRVAAFTASFATIASVERATARRRLHHSRWLRWPNNLGITGLNSVILHILAPLSALAAARLAAAQGWGLLRLLPLPVVIRVLAAVVALDLVIYSQHRFFHAVPLLWRVHRMHHADLDFDVTTGTRFHPIEMVLSAGVKLVAVLILGAPAVAVLLFEVLLNATSMFNHGNICLPAPLDTALRWLVVTPDMHRVHHSAIPLETNSNYGFNLPWWDYLFGTYRAQPRAGHLAMVIGIERFRTPRDLWLDRMLLQPFAADR
jgi:sterol desaturase/sphingolipid hydroxylase (fatty acid hydroxylase superfamily)